jgi:hypothetical protein
VRARLPLQKSSSSPATAPENYLMACKYSPLGTPRGRYDEHSSKSSLSCNTSLFVDQIKTLVGCFILGELKTFAKYCAWVLLCVISCACMCMIVCECVCVTDGMF